MRSTSLRQTSSTVMLRQVAGLLVHPSRCTQRWSVRVHAKPDVITLSTSGHHAWCLRRLGHRLFSCRLVAASEFVWGKVSKSCSRHVRDLSPWHSMANSSAKTFVSPPSRAPGRTPVLQLGCELSLSLCAAAHKTISRAAVTNTCQPQQRTTITARVSVKV